jgi:hypothetical protein
MEHAVINPAEWLVTIRQRIGREIHHIYESCISSPIWLRGSPPQLSLMWISIKEYTNPMPVGYDLIIRFFWMGTCKNAINPSARLQRSTGRLQPAGWFGVRD